MELDLIGVPYTSAAKPGGIARAIGVLREAGLAERVAARDAGDLELVVGDGQRGPSGFLNEAALGHLVRATHVAVGESLGRGRRPLLVGGDCPVLLGALAAGRDREGEVGLLLVDGHEDAWPPATSDEGEASDSEVGIALGLVDELPEPLDELVPLLAPERVAMLGPRDRAELNRRGIESQDGRVALFENDERVRALGPARAASAAVAALPGPYWLHLDLDVLSTEAFPAADYLQPGGVSWDDLMEIATPALADPRCVGASVVIYNPDLDPTRESAERIVEFLGELVERR